MNIYFCQFTDILDNNIYLPYTIGAIIAYLKNTGKFEGSKFNILFIKETIEKVTSQIKKPDYLFMSVYMWNFNYSMEIAKVIKDKYPDCKIVLGGHQVPLYSRNFFKKFSFVDILVHGEGELTCELILEGKSLYSIHNISFNKDSDSITNKIVYSNLDLSKAPSPYLTNVFDNILELPFNYTGSLETNRGCPFGCAYCDWGSCMTMAKKLRFFPQEKIFQEIEWFAKNKIQYIFGCDSNFGIVKSDMSIIDKFIQVKKEYGYPEKFRVCYNKESDNFIFRINKKLNRYKLSKGATLSFQSLNEESLKAVKRKNMSLYGYTELVKKYNEENIPTYTEMIIGLPGETFASFIDGICKLLDAGQHSSIIIHKCQVYPNSELNSLKYKKQYGIEIIDIPTYIPHTTTYNAILEQERLIVSTNTLSREDYVKSCLFAWTVQVFHCFGLTQLAARYLKEQSNISYKTFYLHLLRVMEAHDNSLIGQEYKKIEGKFKEIEKGIFYIHEDIPDFNWLLEEGSFLTFIKDKEKFYFETSILLERKFPIIGDILKLNSILIKDVKGADIDQILSKTDLHILETLGIEHELNSILLIRPRMKYASFKEYAKEVVWYGRKGGSFLYSKNEVK
jgi:putative methyltransferase